MVFTAQVQGNPGYATAHPAEAYPVMIYVRCATSSLFGIHYAQSIPEAGALLGRMFDEALDRGDQMDVVWLDRMKPSIPLRVAA